MRQMKTVTIPAKKREQIDFVTCDLCGKRGNSETHWDTKSSDIREVDVMMQVGESYPECGNAKETRYHICPECFESKLMVWLKEQGAKETMTESEW
jgi:DNA-directed RNA polymerase subunit M/transcription elongation factor TFIIS